MKGADIHIGVAYRLKGGRGRIRDGYFIVESLDRKRAIALGRFVQADWATDDDGDEIIGGAIEIYERAENARFSEIHPDDYCPGADARGMVETEFRRDYQDQLRAEAQHREAQHAAQRLDDALRHHVVSASVRADDDQIVVTFGPAAARLIANSLDELGHHRTAAYERIKNR